MGYIVASVPLFSSKREKGGSGCGLYKVRRREKQTVDTSLAFRCYDLVSSAFLIFLLFSDVLALSLSLFFLIIFIVAVRVLLVISGAYF